VKSRRPPVFGVDDAGRQAAVDVLRGGGIVALPTDTVYGIGVALSTPGGVERLFEVKKRPPEKAIMVLVEDLAQVTELVGVPPAAAALASLWPGGLTLVLPLLPGVELPRALTAGTTSLGVRIPDHQVPRYLARAVGPLPTTSANPSGHPDARSAEEVIASLGDRIDAVVDGGRSRGGVPSTVLDCTMRRVRVIRSGAIAASRIAALLDAAGIEHELGEATDAETSADDPIVGR
jgi:L-threonylcarbamoyladenylate synthase